MIGAMNEVVTYLNPAKGTRSAHLKVVAVGSKVPYDTLVKIATGAVTNPRIKTVESILSYKQQKTPLEN